MAQKPSVLLLLWLVAGAVAIALAWLLDSRVDSALDVSQNPQLHRVASLFSRLGEEKSAGYFGELLIMRLLTLSRV